MNARFLKMVAGTSVLIALAFPAGAAASVGIVSHVKVVSDKVPDVSSLEAWRRAFIKDGMTDEQKAIAVWRSSFMFTYQDPPPLEYLQESCAHDAIKNFNVYGYGMCCCASARVEQLARFLGLPARGFGINAHSVPEVFYDQEWHLFDASLVNYFTRADGKIASVSNVCEAVRDWSRAHPEVKGSKLMDFQKADGWLGWKKGPELLTHCQFYDWSGWWPAKTHGWYSTMQEYDGTHNTPFVYEYGYSQGYEVNVQLRRGERLTRNWSNHGLHVNGVGKDGEAPGCLKASPDEGSLAFLKKYGDLTHGRVGSGVLEYGLPLADGSFRDGMLAVENLVSNQEKPSAGAPVVRVSDPAKPAVFEWRMPSSYVYLTGKLEGEVVVGTGGKVQVLFSDNHGLDWREAGTIEKTGPALVDLQKLGPEAA